MADKKISALTGATIPLDGTEVLPIVQSGATVKVANNDLRPKQIQSNATSGVVQIVGPTAAATRIMTTPDANFTVARTDAAQSFVGDQTLSTGSLILGTSGTGLKSTGTIICQSSSSGVDWAVYSIVSATNPAYFVMGNGTVNGIGTGANGAGAAMYVNRDTGTLRSINAAGSLNALGADYAEYILKDGDFTIAKGDVCGIKANGKLTNVFTDAIAFVVKSTDPAYVGSDTWFNEAPPEDEALLESWKQRLESARKLVDRIAFCGQVPVNVQGATAGQYIIPLNDNGAIKGKAISNPTFEQYQVAVGKVIAIETDGRAKIIIKIS